MVMRVAIIGAGPCGLLLANYLIRRPGCPYQVDVFERRSDFKSHSLSDSRTFPLAILSRGETAIRRVPGLWEAVEKAGVTVDGVCLHRDGGKVVLIPRPPNTSIDRNALVKVLMDQLLEKEYKGSETTITPGSKASICFQSTVSNFDFVKKTFHVVFKKKDATGKDDETEPLVYTYDHLVVCDGANSSIRKLLSDQGKLVHTERMVPDKYRTIYLKTTTTTKNKPKERQECSQNKDGKEESESEPSSVEPEITLDMGEMHGWMSSTGSGGDYSSYRILGVPLSADSLHGVFIFTGEDPFEDFSTEDPSQLYDFLKSIGFASVAALISKEEALAFLKRPTSTILSVTTDRLHVGGGGGDDGDGEDINDNEDGSSILLMGDAAHAVSPSLGQGCNSALEDVRIFCDECLDVFGDDNWTNQALPAFTSKRLEDAHAVVEMSHYNNPRTSWMRTEFLIRLMLKRYLPLVITQYMGKMPMDAISEGDGDRPYSEAFKECRWWTDRVKASEESTAADGATTTTTTTAAATTSAASVSGSN